MLRKNKMLVIVTTLLTLLPMAAGLLLWKHLPERLATSFDFNGTVTGTSSRAMAVFGLPLFCALMHLYCIFGTLSDPKRKNLQPKMFRLILFICPAVSLLVSGIIYSQALGTALPIDRLLMVFIGVLFLALGNYLPKCRQTYTVGIRTPWTLASEENWNRTHRMAGTVWVAAGVVILLMGVMGLVSPWLFFALVAVTCGVPMIYSYLLYRREREN